MLATAGYPNVITFTGFREDIRRRRRHRELHGRLRKIVGYAEEEESDAVPGDAQQPRHEEMKGHPGYQGDHTDYCIDIIKQVGSPRLKLLFDIYHVQIMDGDVIRRIRQHAGLHRPRSHGRQSRPRRIRRQTGDQLSANHAHTGRSEVHRLRRSRVHSDAQESGKGLEEAVRLCDV